MIVYLTPIVDDVCEQDMERLSSRYPVRRVVLNAQTRTTVRNVVHMLTHGTCTALVLPDDYHRHTQLIEYVKICALAADVRMSPVTRYISDHAPAPATAPVHANAAAAGVGATERMPAEAG